jgi:hypothetical protein
MVYISLCNAGPNYSGDVIEKYCTYELNIAFFLNKSILFLYLPLLVNFYMFSMVHGRSVFIPFKGTYSTSRSHHFFREEIDIVATQPSDTASSCHWKSSTTNEEFEGN